MNEGEIVTEGKLKLEWNNTLSTFDLFIKGGHKIQPIRLIITHIMERGYYKVLFPGTSMYSLLISIPVDNKVNFDKTLRIEFDQLTETLKFSYRDWTGFDRQNADLKKQIKWEEACQATEGSVLLESFLAENEDFKKATHCILRS